MRRGFLSLVIVGLAGAGLAVAHNTSTPTTIPYANIWATEDPDTYMIYGTVDSPRARCQRDRTVEVWVITAPSDPGVLVDTDTTSSNGAWAIIGNFANGGARVKVLRSVTGGTGHRHVCKAAETILL